MGGHLRRLAVLWMAILLGLALSACGQPNSGDGAKTSDTGAFPVTVATKFGDVRIRQEPKRVVALGWSDAETALALGVQPVGASDWLDFGGNGVGPWAVGKYDSPPKLVGTNEINYEEVAALNPDLILNTRSAGSRDTHETLSKIAPTIGPPSDTVPYGTGWRQQLSMVSTALGKQEEGRRLRTETEQAFAEATSEHPVLKGKTVGVGAYYGSKFGAYLGDDSRIRFMRELGMHNKPAIDKLGSGSFYVDISREKLDVLSADLTVIFAINGDPNKLRNDPLLRKTSAARNGNLVILEDQRLVKAFSSGSVSGMRYALQKVAPVFAEHTAHS